MLFPKRQKQDFRDFKNMQDCVLYSGQSLNLGNPASTLVPLHPYGVPAMCGLRLYPLNLIRVMPAEGENDTAM